MRVLALPRYGALGASSRMRLIQYLPWLENSGIQVMVSPLFSDAYVTDLQSGRRDKGDVLRSYFRRLMVLFNSRAYDLLWIEKELLPWLPGWFEQVLLSSRVPYVLDYDDAVFHYYDQHRYVFLRHLLGGKHSALMRSAALVVAGNQYLAEYAQKAGARHVELVPTVVDTARYPTDEQLANKTINAVPCVGWIGQRSTAGFLQPYANLFRQLRAENVADFAAIGIDSAALGLPMHSIPWTEATEANAIASLDVGIMPLVDEPFERGKCGYKLIQYMACGLPVVASPVGVNCQIVEHGVNGFLVETNKEWESVLRILIENPELRLKMGARGRDIFKNKYSLQVHAPRVASLLRSIFENNLYLSNV